MPSPLRRRIRHTRRLLGYGLLVVLILAAAVVGLLNQALPLLEEQPESVAAWLSDRIGEPVSFSHASGEWTRRGLRLTLDDLRIGAGDRSLDIGRAELMVAVYSGLLPGEPLTELKVRDLSLVLEQGEDRRWRMAGLPFEPKPGVDPLDTLEKLGELQIERAQLSVRSPLFKEPLVLPRVDLRLRVSGTKLRAGLRAWADRAGTPMSAVVDLQRDGWSGLLWAGGNGLRLEQWSRLLVDTGVVVAGAGDIDLWARIDQQRVMDVRSRADFAPLALSASVPWHVRPDGRRDSPAAAFERVGLLGRWQVDDNGWQLHVPELRFKQTGRSDLRRLDGVWIAGGQRYALQAPRLDLAPARALAALSPVLPRGLRLWLHEAAPDGEVLAVNLQGVAGQWSGTARLQDVGWSPYANNPGIQGIAGDVAVDQGGGVLRLDDGPASFNWPRFRQPLDFRLAGTLGWWREGERWTAGASDLLIRGRDFGARVRAELQFQGDGTKPRLDLAAMIDPTTVQAAKKFWVVGKMPQTTIDWLDRALEAGTVEAGRVVLAGDLDDWPFREGQGRFDARVRLRQGRVAFNPAWPSAEALDLDVSFDGPGMALEGEGMIHGNRVDRVAGGIANFRDPRLRLDIDTPANGEPLQALLLASPLRQRYEEHLINARIRGPAAVVLELDLPLVERLGARRIEGTLDLLDGSLADPRWQIDFAKVNGRTRFSDHGFSADQLAVEFEGAPAVFSLKVGERYTGEASLAARATLDGSFPPQALLARHEPLAWLREWLAGDSAWNLQVDVPQPPAGQPTPASRLTITSDLVGTTISLPAPLAKSPEAAMPLRLQAFLPVSGGEMLLQLGELMRMRARIGKDEALTGLIQFGGGPDLAMPAQGLVVRGSSPTLDAAGWIGFASDGEGDSPLREVDLRVATLDLLGSPFPETRVRLQRDAEGTHVRLSGNGVSGKVDVPPDLAQGIRGNFDRLHWPDKPVPAADAPPPSDAERALAEAELAALEAGTSQDPSVLPPLRFTVEDLRVGKLELGRAELVASPMPQGLHIDRFSTRSPSLELLANGDWLRTGEGASRSRFEVEFTAGSLGQLLEAFGLAGMVKEGETRGRLDGSWPGSPGAFALVRFTGRLRADVAEGQLLEVEPGGGGRVLGLISLTELPRRLTLDFKDFFNKGFGFNTMGGEFVFADGRATTDLLQINGPAAEIRVSGSTDLRKQQYDQRIEVLPKAGGVLPAIGLIAGGPVGAAVGAVAQAVLQQPLKQAARTVYQVTGPWKDPKVEVVERGPPPASAAAATPEPRT